MIRYQEAVLISQEEKGDKQLKAWCRLPKIQQNVIVLTGVEDNGKVPEEPTEEMLFITVFQNGVQIKQYLRTCMPCHNMSLKHGFCTVLNKGMHVCHDDVDTPNKSIAFLIPPVNDDEDADDNENLLKLAVQEKYDNSDLILLSKMDITILMKTHELKYYMKNIASCTGSCYLIFHTSLKQIVTRIDGKETRYNYTFCQEKLFVSKFLHRIDWCLHRFFDSRASGKVFEIDTKKLVFQDMLEQVEPREYHTKVPAWIRKLMKKKEKKTQDRDNNHRRRGQHGGN